MSTSSTDESLLIDRRSMNFLKTVLASVCAPLICAIVLGYVTLYTTSQRLTLIAEYSERRLAFLEQEFKRHEGEYRNLQLTMTRQTQILEQMSQYFPNK